jgi:nucleotide-binding universal stress UspA family protein
MTVTATTGTTPTATPTEEPAPEALAGAMFARILVPLDFSPACRRAVVVAYDLARRYGSEIHVFNLATFGANSEYLASLGRPRSRDDVTRDACDHVRDYIGTVVPGAAPYASCEVAMGDDLVAGVADAAQKCGATCIVLAVHQHRRRPLLRTRAEKIVQTVPVPVILVKAPEEPVVHYD